MVQHRQCQGWRPGPWVIRNMKRSMVYVLCFIGFKTKLKDSIKDQGQSVIFCGVNGVGVAGSQHMPKTGGSPPFPITFIFLSFCLINIRPCSSTLALIGPVTR